MQRLKTWWSNRSAKQKKVLVICGVLGGLFGIFLLAYRAPEKSGARRRNLGQETDVRLDGGSFEDAKYVDLKRKLEAVIRQNEALRAQGRAEPRPADPSPRRGEGEEAGTEPAAWKLPDAARLPPPPPPPRPLPPPPAPPREALPPPSAAQIVESLVGGIGVASNEPKTPEPEEDPEKKKAQGSTVYLPPSFMEATLLTGVDASTSGDGKKSPEPILLRIQKPAVLPNRVKANLRGCFLIAEATGSLAKERAMVRLVSLSCLDNGGQAVIDQQVKGFVVDRDGKVGLGGRVVSKMGAATARAVIAGIFGGVGEALQAASQSQSVSALGVTQVVDTGQLARASVGGGLSAGANTLRDFYLDLAKEATPVIEIGSGKDVTVVVSEGVELEIRNLPAVVAAK